MIAYDLEVKTYNDLIHRSNHANATPLILILMCLPADAEDWLLLSEQELPCKQILDPEAIVALLIGSLQ